MKFREAVSKTPPIADALKKGLRAISRADRQRIKARRPQNVSGSVNVDLALKKRLPNESRWDYAVGYCVKGVGSSEKVLWIEVHPGKNSEIGTMVKKVEWLKAWLKDDAPHLDAFDREFIWVSTGRTRLAPRSSSLKRLAMLGLRFSGRRYTIPDGTR